MKCPKCASDCSPEFVFCPKCGAQLGVTVVRRAEEPGAAAVAALQRVVAKEYAERLLAMRGKVFKERRVVTMLFSDVKGSSAMAREMDPEDWAEIMDGAFDFLIEPIYRYEGTLARLMGDAILAFFGAPIAHEDDPERACRAALEIIEGAQRYAAQLEQERGIAGFNVRVGIHTGLVVVGEAGSDLRVEYTAMGDAINLASRMQGAAEPGTVLITEETHKLIAPLFETEALGTIQVKGRTQPVSTYRVLAAKEVPAKVRGIAGLESPLVGRQAELASLREALGCLQAGEGGIVTLVGEAGIGKSRLVAEVRKEAGPDVRWVEGRCVSYGGSIAYLLWLDVLRGLLGVTLDDAPNEVDEALRERVRRLCPDRFDDMYPYLARLMSVPLSEELASKLEDMDGAALKASTFGAVETLVQCVAEEQPLALVCEDLHWADPTSLELLRRVLGLTGRVPMLLLCVMRPVKEHGSWKLRETAARDCAACHTDLVLDPLSADESQALVSNLLRIEDLPKVLRERILSRAEGNPFYVEEVIRSLIDRDAIVLDEGTGRWMATREVDEIPIPDTLQGVLMARIDRLQEDTRRVLQMASVIGRIFLYRVLAAIAEEERRLGVHLSNLQREEMIRERARIPELEYIFKHDLTREAAYNGLLKKQRRLFHHQVAEAWECLFPERIGEHLGLLAYHWQQAGDAGKAVHYLQRAGDAARLMYSHQEAIVYYRLALALLKEQEQHEQAARTLMKLGLAYHTAFDFPGSRQAYEQASALWRRVSAQERPALPPAPHALRMPSVTEPATLDPAMCHRVDDFSARVIPRLFSGLVRRTPDWDIVPDVAEGWEILAQGRRYVFHLRDDARWTDGILVTAHDFEYAWKRLLDPRTASPSPELLYPVKGARAFHQGQVPSASVGVKASDAHTLVVELDHPTGHLLQLLSCTPLHPVPRHMVERHGSCWTDADKLVSNGPFRLLSWRRRESMVLVRSTDYHGSVRGNLQRLELSFMPAELLLQSYAAGHADILKLLYAMPAAQRERARQRYPDELIAGPAASTAAVIFDVTRPPFEDVRVRRAFVLATDRESYAGVAWDGYPLPALGGFVPPGMPGHSPGIGLPYDPYQARWLLAEAGYPGGHGFPAVEFLTFHATQASDEYLRVQWQQNLGLEIAWESLPYSAFLSRLEARRPHAFSENFGSGYADPDGLLRETIHALCSGWHNTEYEYLIGEATRTIDQSERMKLYRQADAILVQEAPILSMMYVRYHTLVKPWVKNYPGPWKDVIIEPH